MLGFCIGIVFLILLCNQGWTQSKDSENVVSLCRKLLPAKMPNLKVQRILEGPIPGTCEIWSGTNVLYYYPDKNLMIIGEIFDVTTGDSLTQVSRDKILHEKIEKLPFDVAIKWGTGKVKVILFTDPDCPFCRRVERDLFTPLLRDKIRVFVFLFPLKTLHPQAEKHSLNIICSSKPIKKLLEYANYQKPVSSSKLLNKCSVKKARERLRKMVKAAESLNLRGVPLLVVEDKIIRGARIDLIYRTINSKLATSEKRNL